LTSEVELAIKELIQAFPEGKVEVEPDTDGGAWVVVHSLSVGPTYEPDKTWFGFQVTFQYPRADVYPHFVDGALHRKDGRPLGEAFSGITEWRGRSAVQVSRASKRLDPLNDTAATKLAKVLEWVRAR
jgi:hypothetical protein